MAVYLTLYPEAIFKEVQSITHTEEYWCSFITIQCVD